MPNDTTLNDYQYVLCPGSQPSEEFKSLYETIYKCWEQVWQDTYNELKMDRKLASDTFTRQDYVGAIFFQRQCIGMAFYRWASNETSDFSRDSYFNNWSEEHLKVLGSRGSEIIVCSNYTIHPNARGLQMPLVTRDLLLGMIIETFLHSGAHAMTAATRLDRKVNEVCTRWGATPIASDLPSGFGDARVDLLGFFKDVILNHNQPPLKSATESLWENRLEIPRSNVHLFPQEQRLKKVA